jgi:NAD+ kinase
MITHPTPFPPMHCIGILHHPRKPDSTALARQMAALAQDHGCSAWLDSAWDETGVIDRMGGSPELDMLITLGGDGTILRAARMGAYAGIPILGVKMGRLGFLAEVEPENWQEPLEQVLAGQYWLERRLMLEVTLRRDGVAIDAAGRELHFQALNEVAVSRGRLARLVRVSTWIDGDFLTTYAADGVIVSTATGSTGYALAAGGPILPPELRNILVAPIAPHLSLDRALVLSEGSVVRLVVAADHEIVLSVDGQFDVEVRNGDAVEVAASDHSANFVRIRPPAYFYRNLMQRLKWNL